MSSHFLKTEDFVKKETLIFLQLFQKESLHFTKKKKGSTRINKNLSNFPLRTKKVCAVLLFNLSKSFSAIRLNSLVSKNPGDSSRCVPFPTDLLSTEDKSVTVNNSRDGCRPRTEKSGWVANKSRWNFRRCWFPSARTTIQFHATFNRSKCFWCPC